MFIIRYIKTKFILLFILIKELTQTINKYKSPDDKEKIKDYLAYKKHRKPKGVVYTCIVDDYDDIYEIENFKYINKDWDYIFYTNNEEDVKKKQIGIWEVRPLVCTEFDSVRNNRWHKLNPHKLFPEYEQSIYIDANINFLTDYLFNLIEERNLNFLLPKHFKNTCIYQEYKDVLNLQLDKKELINKELSIIKEQGMPENYGFCENNVLYRKHNDGIIKNLDEEWWFFVKNYAKRDQLSLCYLLWKYKFDIKKITFNNTKLDTKNFYVMKHKNKRVKSL